MTALAAPSAALNKTLFQLSFPLFLNSFVTVAAVLLDTMIISAHSAEAAAAVNVANQILVVAYEFSAMLGVGGVILIAHNLGHGKEDRAREIAATTIIANTVLGVLIGIVLALATPLVLTLLNTPEAVAGEAAIYLYIVSAAMAFNGFMVAAIPCLRGFGRSRTILALGLSASVLYICLEYVLVLGFGPIPALGVVGSGIGTLAIRLIATAALAILLVRRLGLDFRRVWTGGAPMMVGRIFGLSFPSVSDNIAYGLYQLILLGFVASFGVASVLARAYVMITTVFLTMGIMAISQGNEVLLGYRRGTGDAHRQAVRSALLAATCATGLAAVIYFLSDRFIGLFTADPAVHSLARELLLLTIGLQPGFAVNAILFHSLKAAGDVRWPAIVSQVVTWGLSLPLAWFLCVHQGYGVTGIWYAMIAEETIKAVLMARRWRTKEWEKHELV